MSIKLTDTQLIMLSAAAQGDDPYIDAATVSRTIASITGGTTFESLTFSTAAAATSITDTIDVTTVTLSAPATVTEAQPITYPICASRRAWCSGRAKLRLTPSGCISSAKNRKCSLVGKYFSLFWVSILARS